MKILTNLRTFLCGFILLLSAGCGQAPSSPAANYDLYLLIGQSNMAGRGALDTLGPEMPNDRVFMLTKESAWRVAVDPLHFDKPDYVGVGPGLSFGASMAEKSARAPIGLIPAAVGGSPIAAWKPGGYHAQTKTYPYDEAIARARAAMKNGTLKGIIWHQGESDADPQNTVLYQDELTTLFTNLRRDLNAPDIPIIVGGLGEFLENPEAVNITAILQGAPKRDANVGFVSATGLGHMGDGVHFNATSARKLGARYAAKMQHMQRPYAGYTLVWSDEFNEGALPDLSKWNYRVGDGCPKLCGYGNGEWQWYTDGAAKNARVENGRLIIQAHKENIGKSEYTSARLNSRFKGDWLYGRIEIRAKMPKGRGTWPAIWMMASDMEYGNWPNSGEIDILEHLGSDPDEILGTVHTESFNHMIGTHKGAHLDFSGTENNFHIYGINWDANKIEFFVDDIVYFTFENTGGGHADYPFDKRFYLILNIAVGGSLGNREGVDPSAFPSQMEIDFVRVYQSTP